MKINRLILICIIISAGSLKIYGQSTGKSFFSNLYIKAGIEGSSFANPDKSFTKIGENTNYFGGLMYDYSKQIQFEVLYRKNDGNGREFYNIQTVAVRIPGYDETFENRSAGESFSSNSVDLKLNYFFMNEKRHMPVYLTSSVIFDVQKRSLYNIYSKGQRYSPVDVETQILILQEHSYSRFLAGASAGVGFLFSLSMFNFQTEFSIKSVVSPFVDRGYHETQFNLSFASSVKL